MTKALLRMKNVDLSLSILQQHKKGGNRTYLQKHGSLEVLKCINKIKSKNWTDETLQNKGFDWWKK